MATRIKFKIGERIYALVRIKYGLLSLNFIGFENFKDRVTFDMVSLMMQDRFELVDEAKEPEGPIRSKNESCF
jgi:hypothetical protein